MYILKIKPNKRWIYVQKMLKDRLYYGSQTVSVPYYLREETPFLPHLRKSTCKGK